MSVSFSCMRDTFTGENLIPLNLEIEATYKRNNTPRRRREQQEGQINQREREDPYPNHPLPLL